MQAASDIFLGWQRVPAELAGQERDFYLRQLWDAKGSALVETMSPKTLGAYGSVCGWTLARAHARSGDRVAIAAYLGKSDSFDRAIQAFAEAYADQNERDFVALAEAVRSGRLVAQTGL
jgi:predicted alpha/beta hydrolase